MAEDKKAKGEKAEKAPKPDKAAQGAPKGEKGSEKGGALILMPLSMKVGMLFLAIAMCITAALVSINKVTKLDPAMVFKG